MCILYKDYQFQCGDPMDGNDQKYHQPGWCEKRKKDPDSDICTQVIFEDRPFVLGYARCPHHHVEFKRDGQKTFDQGIAMHRRTIIQAGLPLSRIEPIIEAARVMVPVYLCRGDGQVDDHVQAAIKDKKRLV